MNFRPARSLQGLTASLKGCSSVLLDLGDGVMRLDRGERVLAEGLGGVSLGFLNFVAM